MNLVRVSKAATPRWEQSSQREHAKNCAVLAQVVHCQDWPKSPLWAPQLLFRKPVGELVETKVVKMCSVFHISKSKLKRRQLDVFLLSSITVDGWLYSWHKWGPWSDLPTRFSYWIPRRIIDKVTGRTYHCSAAQFLERVQHIDLLVTA